MAVCSQKPSTGIHPEPALSSPHFTHIKIHFNIILRLTTMIIVITLSFLRFALFYWFCYSRFNYSPFLDTVPYTIIWFPPFWYHSNFLAHDSATASDPVTGGGGRPMSHKGCLRVYTQRALSTNTLLQCFPAGGFSRPVHTEATNSVGLSPSWEADSRVSDLIWGSITALARRDWGKPQISG
jgi:hypothetical protein